MKVVVTTNAINEEFVEQIKDYSPKCIVAGSITRDRLLDTIRYAKQLGITLITIGDFEVHYPGMEVFTRELNSWLIYPQWYVHRDISAVFIPNYKIGG